MRATLDAQVSGIHLEQMHERPFIGRVSCFTLPQEVELWLNTIDVG
jgi:hypothetical protein